MHAKLKSSLSKSVRAQVARDFATHIQSDLAAISHGIDEIAGRTATTSPTRHSLRKVQDSIHQLTKKLDLVKEDEAHLTSKESEVLHLLRGPATAQEIADSLQLSLPTIKSHIAAIYRKLGVRSRAAAIAEAKRLGI